MAESNLSFWTDEIISSEADQIDHLPYSTF
jgi:hypothetical protein